MSDVLYGVVPARRANSLLTFLAMRDSAHPLPNELSRITLSADQKILLQAVYDCLKSEGRWPSVREMRIRFHDEFDVVEVGRSMPVSIFNMDEASTQGGTCRLTMLALYLCQESTEDRDVAARYIRHLGQEYVLSADEKVSIPSAQRELGIDDARMQRVMTLTQYESLLTRGSMTNAQGQVVEVMIAHEALALKNVETLEDYYVIKAAHYAKLEEQRQERVRQHSLRGQSVKDVRERTRDLRRQLERARNILVAGATGLHADASEYARLRTELLAAPELEAHLPEMLHTCGTVGELVELLKAEGTGYAERRRRIGDEFAPVLAVLAANTPPHAARVTEQIHDVAGVREAWEKALVRQEADPAGAITAARTMVEGTLRHGLDALGIPFATTADLPSLYKLFRREVRVGPTDSASEAMLRILGGAQGAVEGLAMMRNQMSDAHAGLPASEVEAHFAELAVNLAGTMALFIMQSVKTRELR